MIEFGMFYLSFTVAGRCFGCGWWRGYKLLDINTWFMNVTVTYDGDWSVFRVGPFYYSRGPY